MEGVRVTVVSHDGVKKQRRRKHSSLGPKTWEQCNPVSSQSRVWSRE